MVATLATKVKGTVMTSSPGPTPAASSARCKALVPEFMAIHSVVAAVCGKFFFELRNLRTKHKLTTVEHPSDRLVDFRT